MAGAAALVLLASCGGGSGGEAPADVLANDATQTALRAEAELRRVEDSLASKLKEHGFTGAMASTLELRLGRKVDPKLADLGRMLFFDTFGGLHDDNACAGCHSPSAGMGDTQSIAIGVQSNRIVGPGRAGPRNQRRTPMVVNSAFYPALMWNGRFFASSDSPFDNSMGFEFTPPEGRTKFPANDPIVKHLLIAHAHMPLTEIVEVAGFRGITDLGDRFLPVDDGLGSIARRCWSG
jgi:cytochrome c peroxidase